MTRGPGPSFLVWGVWLLMLHCALSFVNSYAGQVPYGDDWNNVEVFTGERPFSLSWLWEPFYGWRLFTTRIILYLLGTVSGFDWRLPRFFNVFLLAFSAILMIIAARRLRGHTRYADAFFPLILLHLGHTGPLLTGSYVCYALSMLLLCGFLFAIAVFHPKGFFLPGILAGTCLVMLLLTGAPGAVLAPVLSVWPAFVAFKQWKDGDRGDNRRRGAVLALAILSVAVTGFYFLDLQIPSDVPASPGLTAIIFTSLRPIAMSFGPALQDWQILASFVLFGVVVVCIVLLTGRLRTCQPDRVRSAGMLLFFLGMLVLALSIGVMHSGQHAARDLSSSFAMMHRYTTLFAPILCAVYLVADLVANSRAAGIFQAVLCAVVIILLPQNYRTALGMGRFFQSNERALMEDLRRGRSPRELAARHWPNFLRSESRMVKYLEMTRKAGIGPYRSAR